MKQDKPIGVAAAQALATDIGYAMQTVEGFEPVKLPQWEMVGKDTDGTPIYHNNWGRYDPWIPKSVRMPPLGEWVLCYSNRYGCCETARVEKHWDGWVTKDRKNLVLDAYTHWMPMPPPPLTAPVLTQREVAAFRAQLEALYKGPPSEPPEVK